MTRTTTVPVARMILPRIGSPCDGRIVDADLADVRRPHRIVFDDEGWPRALDSHHCTAERHLFDVLIATGPIVENEPKNATQAAHLSLTCVLCGTVLRLAATLDHERDPWGSPVDEPVRVLDPVPLTVAGGRLRAQMVSPLGAYGTGTWTVHPGDSERVIGRITWAMGPRGRLYYVGRLDTSPEPHVVEAPTPLAVLRRLAAARTA